MNKRIKKEFDRLNKVHKALINSLPENKQLLFLSPGKNQWSPIQILHHLYESERLSLAYMKKKVKGINDLKSPGISNYIRGFLLWAIMYAPFKLKSPERVDPAASEPSPDLVQDWHLLKKDYEHFFQTLPEGTEKKLLYKHPIAGRITPIDMLVFFRHHLERHQKQLKRSIEQIKKQELNQI